MADGFTELEEKIMAVLVKRRETAAHTIADAHEIAGFIETENAKLRAENDYWAARVKELFLEKDALRAEVEILKDQASAKNDLRAALAKSGLQVEDLKRTLGLIVDEFNAGCNAQYLASIAHAALLPKPTDSVKQKCRCGCHVGGDGAITACGCCTPTTVEDGTSEKRVEPSPKNYCPGCDGNVHAGDCETR